MSSTTVIKKQIDHSQLGTMLKTIKLEYPDATTPLQQAVLITEYFDVECEEMDIIGYNEIYEIAFIKEDFELEARKHEHGHLY